MITIYLKGGLGNQMFQYAYGRSQSLRKKTKLLLDLSDLLFPLYLRNKETPRTYALECFNIQARIYAPTTNPLVLQYNRKFYEWISHKERSFHNENNFLVHSSIIRTDFTLRSPLGPKAESIKTPIEQTPDSVSLHIRRGDYVGDPATNAHHGVLGLDYYHEAQAYIKNTVACPTFFIFSDDISWVKENLKIDSPTVFVSCPEIQDYEELILMSLCNHHIIANSSFSWWGAWLNQNINKIVIAPKQWVKNPTLHKDICPPEWIRL